MIPVFTQKGMFHMCMQVVRSESTLLLHLFNQIVQMFTKARVTATTCVNRKQVLSNCLSVDLGVKNSLLELA